MDNLYVPSVCGVLKNSPFMAACDGIPQECTKTRIHAYRIRELIVKVSVSLNNRCEPSVSLIQEIRTYCEVHKYPWAIEFVDSLPKTITGKIKKNGLREREYKKSMTQK